MKNRDDFSDHLVELLFAHDEKCPMCNTMDAIEILAHLLKEMEGEELAVDFLSDVIMNSVMEEK